MKLDRINHVQLEVADLDRSVRWYKRMLGMRMTPPTTDGARDLRATGDFRLRLVTGTPARARQFRVGIHVESRVELRRWRAHVDASGGLGNPIVEREGYYGFTVSDPDGYMLEFYSEAAE